jgi:hypothetical protein
MKIANTVFVGVLAFGILLILSNCTTTTTPLPVDNLDELVGTWVNESYTVRAQKIVIEPDGVYVAYDKVEYLSYIGTGILELVEKWEDSKGNIYCKLRFDRNGVWVYELDKINKSGTVLEFVQSYNDYPTEIDPNDLEYCVYYRQ